ncbi:MAG: TGS domain-containing protein, partial [Alphaproteobacteria bacterium]|nr:TGS domain-containing protein [Alphaproteobacteria bacterium]
MIRVFLKDGTERSFPLGSTGDDIAKAISKNLFKDAVAITINGVQKDLNAIVPDQARIDIITRSSPEGLEIIRHDTAHVMAQAVQQLYPQIQITIGPAIENGFYYDFYREKPFTMDDLEAIEKRMRFILEQDMPIVREEWQRDAAIDFFKEQGEHFKVELIQAIPEGEIISLYRQGDFIDLCRGPHLPSTRRIRPAFKLMKLAGAYWRGDHRNPMLQRIYGTAWATEEQLKQHLHFLEEAEKRDHRKLGPALGLFHQQEEAVGNVFWHPKGWTLYQTLQQYIAK